jgi:hypothetical protein
MNSEEVKNTICEIGEVADLFYMQKNNDAYNKLSGTLIQISDILYKLSTDVDMGMKIDVNKLNQILYEAMNAIENKDSVLLADILQYELVEQFNNLLELLN